ncbi:hypothetical protein TREES_T100001505 [Tupaia chinensis]|uniref:Uncharacterized protein n=1 Tax=Tupaia chinensis TaxID=246437 RepID=L9KWY5_TUPCH|nr:hypothetical protein TREES_T100001505 [Tupaia chinensis]
MRKAGEGVCGVGESSVAPAVGPGACEDPGSARKALARQSGYNLDRYVGACDETLVPPRGRFCLAGDLLGSPPGCSSTSSPPVISEDLDQEKRAAFQRILSALTAQGGKPTQKPLILSGGTSPTASKAAP